MSFVPGTHFTDKRQNTRNWRQIRFLTPIIKTSNKLAPKPPLLESRGSWRNPSTIKPIQGRRKPVDGAPSLNVHSSEGEPRDNQLVGAKPVARQTSALETGAIPYASAEKGSRASTAVRSFKPAAGCMRVRDSVMQPLPRAAD